MFVSQKDQGDINQERETVWCSRKTPNRPEFEDQLYPLLCDIGHVTKHLLASSIKWE